MPPTGGDGASWATAYKYLQDGLAAATDGDEIWVAKGVYYPDEDEGGAVTANDVAASFTLKAGVDIYGGFAGVEMTRDERNWETNITVLSGDIDQNDTGVVNGVLSSYLGITGKNSTNVVRGENYVGSPVVDGFSITGGDTYTGSNTNKGLTHGGGIALQAGATLSNLVVRGNRSEQWGGGIFIDYSGRFVDYVFQDLTWQHLVVRNNFAGIGGGGIYVTGSSYFEGVAKDLLFVLEKSHVLENVVEVNGPCIVSLHGDGGIQTQISYEVFRDVVFERNKSDCNGGGISQIRWHLPDVWRCLSQQCSNAPQHILLAIP